MRIRKNAAFEQFIPHTKKIFEYYYGTEFLSKRKICIWFSDDTKKNVEAMTKYIMETLLEKYPNVYFMLYDTRDPKIIRKESII